MKISYSLTNYLVWIKIYIIWEVSGDFFYEYITNDINKISKYVNNKYQTLTYFGLDKKEIKKFIVENEVNGIDRVVPIGQALDMSFYWDGYDLNRILSRIVDIKWVK